VPGRLERDSAIVSAGFDAGHRAAHYVLGELAPAV
jgi:hypothetical protein